MKLLNGRVIKPLDSQVNIEPSLIPKLPFSLYITASKGAGKSTMLLNLLLSKDLLAKKFNQIHYISPTAKLDSKTEVLKSIQGIIIPNTKLINKLKETNKNARGIFSDDSENIFTNNINFIDKPNVEFLKELIKEQDYIIKKYTKNLADKILLVYDDTISFQKFWKSEKVQQMFFNSRHYNISIIITSQNYKSLPKALRLNMSQQILFFTSNEDELKSIYAENVSSTNFKEFKELYKTVCQSKPFHFLCVNYQNLPKYRLQSGFEEFIS